MALLLVSGAILYVMARLNYLLFHSLVEGFAIVVAALIYVLATRTYRHSRNNLFLFLGISYLFVAIIDFSHMLTYKGMGVFPGFGSDTPTQLWIAGRFMEALSFLLVLFIPKRGKLKRDLVMAMFSLVTAGLIISIMVFRNFPVCFVEGEGLTMFKVASEYVIIALLLASASILYSRKELVKQGIFKSVGLAMIITAVSELAFTLYTDVYGVSNMVGHMLKVVSYYYIYSGVVAQGIDMPYSLISTELKERAVKDALTGLLNRQWLMELIKKREHPVAEEDGSPGMLMIDLDNFKLINDAYGHLFGDKVLKEFARILRTSIREGDVAIRFGGDEFIILLPDGDMDTLTSVKRRIRAATEDWIAGDERLRGIGISIGSSLLPPEDSVNIDRLIKVADKNMYAAKMAKKR